MTTIGAQMAQAHRIDAENVASWLLFGERETNESDGCKGWRDHTYWLGLKGRESFETTFTALVDRLLDGTIVPSAADLEGFDS